VVVLQAVLDDARAEVKAPHVLVFAARVRVAVRVLLNVVLEGALPV
jgi:hypothetical protein